MTHRQKQLLARKLSGKTTRHFESQEWQTHKDQVAKQVLAKEEKAQSLSKLVLSLI